MVSNDEDDSRHDRRCWKRFKHRSGSNRPHILIGHKPNLDNTKIKRDVKVTKRQDYLSDLRVFRPQASRISLSDAGVEDVTCWNAMAVTRAVTQIDTAVHLDEWKRRRGSSKIHQLVVCQPPEP